MPEEIEEVEQEEVESEGNQGQDQDLSEDLSDVELDRDESELTDLTDLEENQLIDFRNEQVELDVTESTGEIDKTFLDYLLDFYQTYLVEVGDQTFQVFKSFTYGELTIVLLLMCILFVLVFKWIYEVMRY